MWPGTGNATEIFLSCCLITVMPDCKYSVVVVFLFHRRLLRRRPAEWQILLKTLVLRLALCLWENNNQQQQRVGCDSTSLGSELKPLSDQIPALFQQLAWIILVISAGAQLITNTNTFTQWLHAAYCWTLWNIQKPFFFPLSLRPTVTEGPEAIRLLQS